MSCGGLRLCGWLRVNPYKCVSLLRSSSRPNSERPWGRPQLGLGRGMGDVGEPHYPLIYTMPPSGRARPQCARLSAGGLAVRENSPGPWRPPLSGQTSVGGSGGTCLRTTLWALGLGTRLISERDGSVGTWECRCVWASLCGSPCVCDFVCEVRLCVGR